MTMDEQLETEAPNEADFSEHDPLGEVYLEAHGVAGTSGRPAADLGIETSPGLFGSAFWIANPTRSRDLRVGYRSELTLAEGEALTLSVQAASLFRVWIDGELLVHGPLRYAAGVPEFHQQEIHLRAGTHVIAVEA